MVGLEMVTFGPGSESGIFGLVGLITQLCHGMAGHTTLSWLCIPKALV